MSDREFQIGGRQFQLNKIDAMKQFHIVRRVGPIISEIIASLDPSTLKQMQNLSTEQAMAELPESDKFTFLQKAVVPIMTGFAKLSDADADTVLFGLCSSVEVKQSSGGWAKVSTPTMLMIQDLEFPILIQIAGRAFFYNLTSFFPALPR